MSGRLSNLVARFGLVAYCTACAAAAAVAPYEVPGEVGGMAHFLEWLPLADSLVDMSSFPTKSATMFAAAIGLSPLAFASCAQRADMNRFDLIRASRPKVAIVGAVVLAVMGLLLTLRFHPGGSGKGAAVLALISNSTVGLIVIGAFFSVWYVVVIYLAASRLLWALALRE